jgi:glycosyltransferase involved in cell wall biosynthesis
MKVLIVCSGNSKNRSFILDQVAAIAQLNVEFDFFYIEGNGWIGYLKNIKSFFKKLKQFQPNLIHAHYGLSGLFSNFQRRIPVITTYHGSDIHQNKNLGLSKIAILLSKQNIFVSEVLKDIAKTNKGVVIPCGVDFAIFKPIDKQLCRDFFGFQKVKKYVLFSSSFDNSIKNPSFAKKIVDELGKDYVLIELKDFSREQVAKLMSAVDIALLTSFHEGSPQFVKEVIACGCPIVSSDVGDVQFQLNHIRNAKIIKGFEKEEFKYAIKELISNHLVPNHDHVSIWDNKLIAKKIFEEYNKIIFRS